MTYLVVYLKENEEWEFQTPLGQSTGFIFTRDRGLSINGLPLQKSKLAILEHNDGLIKVKASAELSNFILELAELTPYEVLTKGGQIHTNKGALVRSTGRITEIGRE